MTRTIKFRAWDRFKKRFAYISLEPANVQWSSDDWTKQHLSKKDISSDPMGVIFENLEDWQQNTGLLDKNGKEIYEGDIVQHDSDKPFAVTFEDGCFIVEHQEPIDIEIIGNIWEHPELIAN